MGAPAGGSRDDEQRREHLRRHAHQVIGDGGEPVQIRKHLLDLPHHRFESVGDVVELVVAGRVGKGLGHPLDDLVARIAGGIDRVTEADHDLLARHPFAYVGLGLVRVGVALLDLEGRLVGAAVLGAAQCADGAGDAGIQVRTGTGDDPGGEGGGVELVLGIEDQRGVHRAHPVLGRRFAVKQVQEVAADGIVVGFHLDALAVDRVVIPVEQHRTEAGHQPVDQLAGLLGRLLRFLRQQAAEHRAAAAQHIHRVGRRRQLFQGVLQGLGQPAHRAQSGLVGLQLGAVGQLAVDDQVGDFLEFGALGEIEDVVAAIVQVIALSPYGADGGIAGGGAGESDGFLGLGQHLFGLCVHREILHSCSVGGGPPRCRHGTGSGRRGGQSIPILSIESRFGSDGKAACPKNRTNIDER